MLIDMYIDRGCLHDRIKQMFICSHRDIIICLDSEIRLCILVCI